MSEVQHIENDEISLKELILKIKGWFAYLKTKFLLIVFMGLIGGILGFTYAYFQKPTYKAVLTFALEEDKGSGGGLGGALGLASSFGIDVGGGGGLFTSSNILDLMKSRLIIEKTLLSSFFYNNDTITFAEYYLKINDVRSGWDGSEKLKKIQFSPNSDRNTFDISKDSVLETISSSILNNNLRISQRDKKSNFNNIEVVSSDELFAKFFCEALAQEISDFYIQTKSKKAQINLNILQKQADSIRDELNNSILGVASANDNIYNLNPALSIKTSFSKSRQVDVQANTAILSQLINQLELAKVTLRKETPLIQVIDKPILPLEKEKVGKLKSIILGGFLAGFLTVLYLVFGRLYKNLVE